MMTRKHFVFLAEGLRESLLREKYSEAPHSTARARAIKAHIEQEVNRLARTNPNFDRDRFLTAAGYFD